MSTTITKTIEPDTVRALDALNIAEVARRAGLTRFALYKWKKAGWRVPGDYVVPMEAATGISRQKLRPDIFEGMKGG